MDAETGSCTHDDSGMCDDHDACTEDTCFPKTGKCEHTRIACESFDPCVVMSCDRRLGCISRKMQCGDGKDPCIISRCVDGACMESTKVCGDSNLCTQDYCDSATGDCLHVPFSPPDSCNGWTCAGSTGEWRKTGNGDGTCDAAKRDDMNGGTAKKDDGKGKNGWWATPQPQKGKDVREEGAHSYWFLWVIIGVPGVALFAFAIIVAIHSVAGSHHHIEEMAEGAPAHHAPVHLDDATPHHHAENAVYGHRYYSYRGTAGDDDLS
jgi:hypothetical protein